MGSPGYCYNNDPQNVVFRIISFFFFIFIKCISFSLFHFHTLIVLVECLNKNCNFLKWILMELVKQIFDRRVAKFCSFRVDVSFWLPFCVQIFVSMFEFNTVPSHSGCFSHHFIIGVGSKVVIMIYILFAKIKWEKEYMCNVL